jgi:P-type Mg2+ transporter
VTIFNGGENAVPASQNATAYWSRNASGVLAELGSASRGLSEADAVERIRQYGLNAIDDQRDPTALKLFLRQYESPLVLILLFGAALSLFLRQWADATIILAIVLGSTVLGFTQEYRASTAVAALRRRLALTVKVLRDGSVATVPASRIVPGDVIQLSAGNLIPADGVVLEAKDFLVTEAALTGESFPVEKRPGTVAENAPLAARTNSVFLGTSVRSGTASVLVVRTGRATAFGHIAGSLGEAPETEFARGVRQFGYLLIRVMVVLVLFVLTVSQLLGRPLIESLLFAVALAVGLSPELLPAIVSVTLSAGARTMARRGVIVRRLEAIEDLGGMDVLCTDKTGTLTEGVISLSDTVDAKGRPSEEVRALAFVNASFETGIENPLDAAIVTAGMGAGLTTDGYRKIDEIPYDFIRKRLTIVAACASTPDRHLIVTKGAFANVLAACSTMVSDGAECPLHAPERDRLEAYYGTKGSEGYRVLAVATRRVVPKESYGRDDETEMCFVGFLLFVDPPKPDAARTIEDLARLGILTKIISGDNRYVTAHLAQAVGLDPKAMLTGEDLSRLNDEALWHFAARTDLFVEVDPPVSAACRQADPAQQLPVRPPIDHDFDRQCRQGADRSGAALERARNPIVHDRLWADQFGVRHPDIWCAPLRIRRRPADLSIGLVRHIIVDGTDGHARVAHARSDGRQQAKPLVDLDHGRGDAADVCHSIFRAVRRGIRAGAALRRDPGRARGNPCGLRRGYGICKSTVFPEDRSFATHTDES